MTPTPAQNLRPGDIVLHDGYPIDLFDVIRIPEGVVLWMSPVDEDWVHVSRDAVFDVLGHFDG